MRSNSLASKLVFPLRNGVCQTHPACFYWPPAEPSPAAGLALQYLGANSLSVSDGQTRLLIDPYFSRPALSLLGVALGGRQRVIPDRTRIRQILRAAGIRQTEAILVTHAHYDHALDVPTVARELARFQERPPVIIGSESVVNIGRGWGMAEGHMLAVGPKTGSDQSLALGDFHLTFLPSQHIGLPIAGVPFPGHIDAPLSQPARVSAYKAGQVFSLQLVHPLASLLIQGSAGFLLDQERVPRADCLVLPIGGVDLQTSQWREEYLTRVITSADPASVLFSHWDDYHRPLDKPPAWIAGLPGRGPVASLAYFRARQPHLNFDFLPIGLPVIVRSAEKKRRPAGGQFNGRSRG